MAKKLLIMSEEGYAKENSSANNPDGLDAGGSVLSNVGAPVNGGDAANKTYVDAQISSNISDVSADISTLTSDLAAEVARATAAEGVLTSDLASEVARATAAEGVLQSNISTVASDLSTEVARATAAEGVIASDLASEVARATAAEGVLTTNLAAEVTRATAAEGVLQDHIDAEEARALAAEGVLQDNIDAEEARATAAEGVLTTNLASEVSRATAAEAAIASDLSDEITRATAAEAAIASDLADEVARATAAEGVLTTNLASEVSRATAAEAAIASDLSDEIARATAAEGVLTADLASEVARATAAEGVLTADLASEVARATAAEIAIAADLASEVSRATAAEGVLTADLAAEVARATAAEGVIAADLAQELIDRAAGDASTLASAQSYADTAASNAQSAAEAYADTLALGLKPRGSVKVVSESAIASPPAGLSAIGSISISAGDRVLLVAQADAKENGIWVAAAGNWTRPADFAAGFHAEGAFVISLEGDSNVASNNQGWVCVSTSAVVGTDDLAFEHFAGVPSYVAGDGISIDGLSIAADLAASQSGLVKSGGLRVNHNSMKGLEIDSMTNMLGIKLVQNNPSLQFSMMGMEMGRLDLKIAPDQGLSASGQGVKLALNSSDANVNVTGGVSVLHSPTTAPMAVSAEALSAADPVYYANSMGQIGKGDCTNAAKSRIVGLAASVATDAGENIRMVAHGKLAGVLSSATFNTPYYLGEGGGLVTMGSLSSGDRVICVGYAMNATDLWVEIKDYGMKA